MARNPSSFPLPKPSDELGREAQRLLALIEISDGRRAVGPLRSNCLRLLRKAISDVRLAMTRSEGPATFMGAFSAPATESNPGKGAK